MKTYSLCYHVKQYVAEIRTKHSNFRVFRTGDARFYLFAQVDPKTGSDTGLLFPVAKNRLRKDIANALSHGWGYVNQN